MYCNFTENRGCQPLETCGSYTYASNSWASCWILYIAFPWLLCARARVKRLPPAHGSCVGTVLCGPTLVMIFILHIRPSVWLCWELQDDIAPSKVEYKLTIIDRQAYSDAQTRREKCVNIRWYRQTVAKVRGTCCTNNDAQALSLVVAI